MSTETPRADAAAAAVGAVDLFVQVSPSAGGRRVVSSIREVAGLDGERVLTNELFAQRDLQLPAVPLHSMQTKTRDRLRAAGLDDAWLQGWGR